MRAKKAWRLAAEQYGVVALFQLVELGYTLEAVEHRVGTGRLHRVHRGVYAVGRRELTRKGTWMAAVLACGESAVLSHDSAATLWRVRTESLSRVIHISVRRASDPRRSGIKVHRRLSLPPADVTRHEGIRVTTPIRTLLDLGTCLSSYDLEAAINDADKHELVDPVALRAAIDERKGQRGVRLLREILDRDEFVLTDSELERRFLRLVRGARLGAPLTQQHLNGFRVDFYWPDLGLVVETDGLRYHRTAAQQTKDRVRDQAHIAAGLTPLRFTHWQVRYDAGQVTRTLQSAARNARSRRH